MGRADKRTGGTTARDINICFYNIIQTTAVYVCNNEPHVNNENLHHDRPTY